MTPVIREEWGTLPFKADTSRLPCTQVAELNTECSQTPSLKTLLLTTHCIPSTILQWKRVHSPDSPSLRDQRRVETNSKYLHKMGLVKTDLAQ